ncbi:MAG: zinc ribbon domain-containing protein [Candidatus Bathyarchaeota archaeon]|nr:zinc ribbon domain-containing protein [Candidatus Bathyarchaeota archaeon]
MVFCPSCGKANPDDAVYCNYCSKPIPRLNNRYPASPPKAPIITPLQITSNRPRIARKVETVLIFLIIILIVAFILLGSEAGHETLIFANIYTDTYNSYGTEIYRINIDIKNIDSTPKLIDSIYLNGNPYDSYSLPSTPEQYGLLKQIVQPDQHVYGQIHLPTTSYGTGDWNRGDYVKVSIKASTGGDCTTSVHLA